MIKQNIKTANLLSKLLKDPAALQRQVDLLNEASERHKASLAALLGGQSSVELLEKASARESEIQDMIVKAEAKAFTLVKDAEAKVSGIEAKLFAKEQELVDRERAVNTLKAQVDKSATATKALQDATTNALASATAAEQRYKALKKEYEDKLADLKQRFAGL